MSTDALVCWHCGGPLDDLPLPLGRYAQCPACRTDLHVCKMCRAYDPKLSSQCRKDEAEYVHEKTRANFCGHFKPAAGAYRPKDRAPAEQAKAELDALFGIGAAPAADAAAASAAARRAREHLAQLFGLDPAQDRQNPER